MNSGRKYGLQLRGPQTTNAAKKPLPPKKPVIFNEDDDEEDVEQAIARQAAKNRALKEVELQHKAALEQDKTVFSYDEVYDDLTAAKTDSRKKDVEQRKPKYISMLLDKAKARQQEQEIIYERKLLKERQLEDHLYGDKEKYVTSAYKKKLAEQAKWLEEERLRELREQAQEVTTKGDLSDFYHNLLSKNVAFGANNSAGKEVLGPIEQKPSEVEPQPSKTLGLGERSEHVKDEEHANPSMRFSDEASNSRLETEELSVGGQKIVINDGPQSSAEHHDLPKIEESKTGIPGTEHVPSECRLPVTDRKPSEDALAAAKERFLARKKMRTA
ncbi:hypothetical protein KP509_24G041700 [Ceratopteris richardii]|uniref:Nuclear speckle splicing regulatory protein 1 N-terminal domain-containing protein n=1 Tax=Ceratopteris richardii TaxID=49495 RepID=A0A8T2RX77_CERRI|nr:hypothetical protein KP509_24G041700 [Ceratopteris richardii]